MVLWSPVMKINVSFLRTIILEFFADMGTSENIPELEGGNSLTLEQNNMLTASLTFIEFTEAVKACIRTKQVDLMG